MYSKQHVKMEIFTSLRGRKKPQEKREIQPQFQQGKSSMFGEKPSTMLMVWGDGADAFVAQPKPPIFKVKVTFFGMV